ncbi:MAG: hypothetical protein RKU31_30265 [Deltaproteobacteria bacterium]
MRIRRIRTLTLAAGLVLATACADPVDPPREKPDAGPTVRDAGTDETPRDGGPNGGPTHVLETSNLAPAAESASAGDYRIRGHLRSSEVRQADNGNQQIRGGFVPLSR